MSNVEMNLPVFLPGNNRDWSEVKAVARIDGSGEIHIRLMNPADGQRLVQMAADGILYQCSFDYRMPQEMLDKINNQAKRWDEMAAVKELTEAIRLTVEYVGTRTLPPVEGWSWYDAMLKYAPEKAEAFKSPVHLGPEAEEYPKKDGDFTLLGPECFVDPGGNVISYKGENFYRACDRFVRDLPDGGESHCVKRVGHPGDIHEDYHGNTRTNE